MRTGNRNEGTPVPFKPRTLIKHLGSRLMIENWIWEKNLEAFVQIVARLAGYSSFDKDDWPVIQNGVRDTDVERGLWYECPLLGDHPLKLKIARDIGTSVVSLYVEGDTAIEANLGLVIDVCQNFRLLARHS